jgi:hypothetical protein
VLTQRRERERERETERTHCKRERWSGYTASIATSLCIRTGGEERDRASRDKIQHMVDNLVKKR